MSKKSDFRCPNCHADFTIDDLELWEVYEEEGKETEFTCPQCDRDMIITSHVTGWSFSTCDRDD